MIKVLKASAGSGKTFNLTKEYITLLFSSDSETEYRHILAVTFTNKATDEMKERILLELRILADEPEKSNYIGDLAASTPYKTTDSVRRRAGLILRNILHDYSRFSVCTLDKFFQRTMRSFAREIGQSSSYQVELDNASVVSDAFDRMFASLGEKKNSALLADLTEYAENLISDGGSWDFSKPLKDAALGFLKEDFKMKVRGKDIGNFDAAAVSKKLRKIMSEAEASFAEIGREFIDGLASRGLMVTDLKGGSRTSFNYFTSISGGKVMRPSAKLAALAEDREGWATQSSPNAAAIAGAAGALSYLIGDAADLYDRCGEDYFTAKAIGNRLYVIGVFSALRAEMDKVLEEKDEILLSDTTDVLNRIIGDSDAPFIYEKTGLRYSHYMLDEFQDTSLMQWGNFKPLIDDSLSRRKENLVVGDVKQSIYRWRDSDWNLLRGIAGTFSSSQVKEISLRTNFRSAREVVEFNNRFFCCTGGDDKPAAVPAPVVLQAEYNNDFGLNTSSEGGMDIIGIYSDSAQEVAAKNASKKGHVLVESVSSGDGSYMTADKFQEEATAKCVAYVKKLHDGQGYPYRDILLLARTNGEVAALSAALLDADIPVYTDEALELSSSPAVQRVVSALRFLTDSENPLNVYLTGGKDGDAGASRFRNLDIRSTSLYNAVVSILAAEQNVSEDDVSFVNSFLDCVNDFVSTSGSDPVAFLQWWDDVGHGRKTSSPSGCDAVSVMTVHKAKGLQSKAVIIPFFRFKYDIMPGTKFWCSPSAVTDREPFASIPVSLVSCTKSLDETIFSADYRRECLDTVIDNLNLAYVACTRAENELIVIMPRNAKVGRYISNCLNEYLKELDSAYLDKGIYSSGDWTVYSDEGEEDKNAPVEIRQTSFTAVPAGNRLKLTLRGGDFFGRDGRQRGIVRHDILSRMTRTDDLDEALDFFIARGELAEAERAEVRSELSAMLQSVAERHWFDGTYKVRNEADVLSDGEVFRPDRIMVSDDGRRAVVVDYKFGERDAAYPKQVGNYVSILRNMGYAEVEGYIWYCASGDIDEVK